MQIENTITKLSQANELFSGRVKLRRFSFDDINDVFEYASDDLVTEYLTWPSYTSLNHIHEVIEQYYLSNPGVWAIELIDEKKCIGAIDLRISEEHDKGSFGYVLNRNYWSNGYMTEALQAVLDFGFDVLQLNRIDATHYVGNEGSGKVMGKCNMKFEGIGLQEVKIKGVYRDVVHYAILRHDWQKTRNKMINYV